MDEDERPSQQVIHQRVRNRIIEYLETTSSVEEQIAYQRDVPYISVPHELIAQWADWVIPEWQESFGPPVFSPEELSAIERHHVVRETVIDETPDPLPALEELFRTSAWETLRVSAAEALVVFMRRGKFSEEEEIGSCDPPDSQKI